MAAPGGPFDPARPTVFVVQSDAGENSQLMRAETSGTGEFTFTAEGPEAQLRYNAIDWNPADGYVYGVTVSSDGTIPLRAVVRVGQDGVVTRVGNSIIGSVAQWTGAFNPDDGYLYTTNGNVNDQNADAKTLYAIDTSNGQVKQTVTMSGLNAADSFADFAYSDGFFWGVRGTTAYRINPSNGTVTRFNNVIQGAPSGVYGAAWVFGNGNLGFSHNETGSIVQVKISDAGSANPNFEVIGVVPGPSASNNDGAAIPGDPVDLGIRKTAPAGFVPGETVTYNLTVTNHGPGESSGWMVRDTLPASMSDVAASGAGVCTIDGNDLWCSGGRLQPNQSAEIIVTAKAPTDATQCVVNRAEVIGNELDPNESNNIDEAESCPYQIELVKSSDATPDARPGDTITYTVTATNVGLTDYTTEHPAVIVDDLTGVLDDGDYGADAIASRDGDLTYSEPLLTWSGPLAVNESVEVSYTITLAKGGDGVVRNVAWHPEDPNNPEPPQCDPPNAEGRDPVTGEPCAEHEFLLPQLKIHKTADTTELPAVGETVTYTIKLENVGPGDFTATAPARLVDDLSQVIDDGTFNADAEARDGITNNLVTDQPEYEEPLLTWTGPLASGDSVLISYSVEYTGNGDHVLRNNACVPEELTAPGAPACDYVRIPGADLSYWKQVEAPSPVVAGSVLTYTLFFKNNGQAAAVVDVVDDLTHVLDDAQVSEEPVSADGLDVVRVGERISVSGEVPAGQVYSVTYEVTVMPDGQRGDDVAANFVLPPGGTPPSEPVCEPVDGQRPDCTVTPIGELTVVKGVEADSDPVGEGSVLTYTLTFTNTGQGVVEVDHEDVLTGVLDDAVLTAVPVASDAVLTVGPVVDERFAVVGELGAGQSVAVSYEVTVLAQEERGDGSAVNFVVPSGGVPPVECVPGDPMCTVTPLPHIEVDKSSDPASGSVVEAGDEVTYTLTFVNTGQAAGVVEYVDYLAGVLDDAELVDGPDSSDADLEVVRDGDQLLIGGVVAADDAVDVTYTVRVKPDGDRGDNRLGNVLAPATIESPNCELENVVCTHNPIGELTYWKSVNPHTGSTVNPGQTVKYTLHFSNTGRAPVAVNHDDVLTGVLDDAVISGEPQASGPALTISPLKEKRYTVSGELAPGQSETVSYEVTVKESGKRGDDILANFVVPKGETPPEECTVDSRGEPGQCTANHVSDLAITKTSDPASGEKVSPGQKIKYTLTFTNLSQSPAAVPEKVKHIDHLRGVLDDAELIFGPESSDAGLQAIRRGDKIRIVGEVAPTKTVTVNYTVEVKEYAEQGDGQLINVIVPVGEKPACIEDSPTCTIHESPPTPGKTPPPSGELPRVGTWVSRGLLGITFLVLLGGASLIWASRNRHSKGHLLSRKGRNSTSEVT